MKFGTLSKLCCSEALEGHWEEGKIIVCGTCFLPYTAILARKHDPVTCEETEVPSWWTGLLPDGH